MSERCVIIRTYKMFVKKILVLLVIPFQMYGQKTISGKITDSDTGLGLEFASVALKGRPVGTYTDSTGYFSLLIPQGYPVDSIFISSIGYEHTAVSYSIISEKPLDISLKPTIYALREVTITTKKRVKKIGATKKSSTQLAPIYKGRLLAVLFETGVNQAMISSISFNIANICNKDAKVRVRILNCDTSLLVPMGVHRETFEPLMLSTLPMPTTDMTDEQVIVSNLKKGWNTIDFTGYKVSISSGKFYVALEPVECIGCKKSYWEHWDIMLESDIYLACSKHESNRAYKQFDIPWEGRDKSSFSPLINVTLQY